MMKASVFIATSVDGYIARKDGGIDWLGEGDPEGEDYGYGQFFDSVDCLVMGRNTFEKVLSFDAWHYGEKPVVVLTTRSLKIPDKLAATVDTMQGTPAEVVEQLSARGARHLYVDGGVTIQTFLEAGLIQRLTIARIPVLIGDGIPLFGTISRDIQLRHVETKTFENGIVQTEYEVVDAAHNAGK